MYPSPHKEDRRKNVGNDNDDFSKLQRPSFVKAFMDEDINSMSRNKREHNYYHHHHHSSSNNKNDYIYDQEMIDNNKERGNGGGYQFSKSFHDLSFANNMYEPHVFRTNLEENRSGTSVDNNIDLILPPKDYLGYRANERSDGYRTLGAPGSERKRTDKNKSFSYQQKGDAMHKKRSQSFLVQSGNISSDDKYGKYNSNFVPNDVDIQHVRSRQKQTRRSRKLYGDDTSQKYAEDFHKNKRHTYHFPDVTSDAAFNHCVEDLTFTKHLSRENVSNGNLNNKSSTENLLSDGRGGTLVDNQYYNPNTGAPCTIQNKMKSNRTKDYVRSSYLDEIRNSHQRSSSSPPSADAYGIPIVKGKTEGQHRHNNALRNAKKTEREATTYLNNEQVHYSTIDHTKNDNFKYDAKCEKNDASKNNIRSENYVNNNFTHTDDEKFVNNTDVGNECSFLHIEREIPMQSASLEAQKFKTIIFLSGQ